MALSNTWLLPDGIKELLPEQAATAESLRLGLLNCYRSWGYQLVKPPLLEFLESMRVAMGQDLALQTFTVTDQLSGRLLGIRADTTPQVARMDAHSLKAQGPVRLCYCSPVLHSNSSSLSDARELEQIGIELFGSSSIEADLEVIQLMLLTVQEAGAFQDDKLVKLDLGNVEIFRSIARYLRMNAQQEQELSQIVQRKSMSDLDEFVLKHALKEESASLINHLPNLCGSFDVLAQAEELFACISDSDVAQQLSEAIASLKSVYEHLKISFPNVECYFDLGEVRGYDYHTGLTFAVYKEGQAKAIAKGGRYDAIGENFGRSRPASGFSADLRELLVFADRVDLKKAIFAPKHSDDALKVCIEKLRQEGEQVIQSLGSDDEHLKKERCDREIIFQQGVWTVQAL